MYIDLSVHLSLPPTASKDTPEHRQTNVDTDYDLTGPEQEGCVTGCAVVFLRS